MSPALQFVCFTVAVILFVLAAIPVPSRINLVAAGLAVFVFVFAVNAFYAL